MKRLVLIDNLWPLSATNVRCHCPHLVARLQLTLVCATDTLQFDPGHCEPRGWCFLPDLRETQSSFVCMYLGSTDSSLAGHPRLSCHQELMLSRFLSAGNMAAIMEVNESMRKSFLQFEPAPRRGEPEARPYARAACIPLPSARSARMSPTTLLHSMKCCLCKSRSCSL